MAHFTPRSAAQWQDRTADRVGNDSVYSAESSGQPTTSKSSKDSHRNQGRDKKSRDHKGKAPAVTTSQQSVLEMSGANRQIDPRDGSRKSYLRPSDNYNLCVEPATPGTLSPPTERSDIPSQPVTGILKSGSDPNATPAQPSNRHIGFGPPPAEDAPPPNSGKTIYQKKALNNQKKKRTKEMQDEVSGQLYYYNPGSSDQPYRGSSSSARYGEYGQPGQYQSRQAERGYEEFDDDCQGSGRGYRDF